MGGMGIFHVDPSAGIWPVIEELTRNGARVVVAQNIFRRSRGDKRILVVDGKRSVLPRAHPLAVRRGQSRGRRRGEPRA